MVGLEGLQPASIPFVTSIAPVILLHLRCVPAREVMAWSWRTKGQTVYSRVQIFLQVTDLCTRFHFHLNIGNDIVRMTNCGSRVLSPGRVPTASDRAARAGSEKSVSKSN
jgi:hypothetical protein